MTKSSTFGILFGLTVLASGCGPTYVFEEDPNYQGTHEDRTAKTSDTGSDTQDESGNYDADDNGEKLCAGEFISMEAAYQMLELTNVGNNEDMYSIYDRVDGIASLFEDCSDPWGLFPTTYRHITNRIIEAIEDGEIEDEEWGDAIVVDFASRYFAGLEAALQGEEPSWAWDHYYYLADNPDVSRTRAVVNAMIAHLTLDLPYALVAIGTTDDHENDYFVLGELMIDIVPDFTQDLVDYYDTDAEDLLNGFFFGDWIDGVFGEDTTITLNYQTIRTKSWNNRWLLEQWWGGWMADSEIYTAFWTIDGVLATLDAAGTI